MKDSFEKIYFDLIMESNMKLIDEGKLSNTVLAGIAGLGITGGAVLGLNKSSEHSVKNLLDKYPTTQSSSIPSSTNKKPINTSFDKVENISDNDTSIVDRQQIVDDDHLNLTSEEEFVARVIYSETSYKANEEEIMMICQVIANRINHSEFGNQDNPFGVVNVKNAFTCINDEHNSNWKDFKPNLNSRTKLCCKLAKRLMAGDKNFFNDDEIVYYHDNSKPNAWKSWINEYWRPIRLYSTKKFKFYKIVSNTKR